LNLIFLEINPFIARTLQNFRYSYIGEKIAPFPNMPLSISLKFLPYLIFSHMGENEKREKEKK